MDMKEINRVVVEQFRAGGAADGMDRDRLLLLTQRVGGPDRAGAYHPDDV